MLDVFPLYCRQWMRLSTRLKFIAQANDQTRRFSGHSSQTSLAIAPSLVGDRISGS